MPWHRCTAALPKPTPARVAARSIWLCASWSSGSRAALGKYLTVIRKASNEKTSEMGLAPWYAGLRIGFAGRGVRSLYGIAVQDSREWQRTSRPEEAWTAEGIVRVLSGSQIPSVGLR